MQSFLPYPNFAESAKVLDYRRLGKQRVECKQMLHALGYAIVDRQLIPTEARTTGWVNHPCTAMWRGYEHALAVYMAYMVSEWVSRGYNNTMEFVEDSVGNHPDNVTMPPWMGDELVHSSHRSRLMQKAPEHYKQFGWADNPTMRYWWPIMQDDGTYTLEHRGHG